PQRPSPAFFRRLRLCIAKQKSRRRPPSTDVPALRMRAKRPRSNDPHRGRDGRGPIGKRNTTMATIGTFTKTENGYTGTVKTLTLNVQTVKLVPTDGDNERGPDFRIFAGATEFGAAWKKTARETPRSPARTRIVRTSCASAVSP